MANTHFEKFLQVQWLKDRVILETVGITHKEYMRLLVNAMRETGHSSMFNLIDRAREINKGRE